MKRTLSLICAAWLLLTSCQSGTDGSTINQNPQYIPEEEILLYQDVLTSEERLVIPRNSYYFAYSVDLLAVPAPEVPPDGGSAITRPAVCLNGEDVVMIRNFPSEIFASPESYENEKNREDRYIIREMEFLNYETGETRFLPVTGLDATAVYADRLSVNPDGSCSLLGQRMVGNGPSGGLFIRIGKDGNVTEQYPLPSYDPNAAYRMQGDTLFTLLPELYSTVEPTDLTAENLATGEEWIVDSDVFAMDLHGNTLYYMTEEMTPDFEYEVYLKAYDITSGTVREIDRIHAQRVPRDMRAEADRMRFNSFVYCPESEMLYLCDYRNLYAYSMDTREITAVAESDSIHELICANDTAFLASLVSQKLFVFSGTDKTPDPVDAGLPVLNVCINSAISGSFATGNAAVITNMRKNEIGISVSAAVHVDSTAAYVNTMAKKLLAGDSDFDIFEVTTEMLDLLKEGYYEDLSRYPILDAYYGRMTPGVKSMCMVGDVPALIPRSLETKGIAVNSRLSDAAVPGDLRSLLEMNPSLPDGKYLMTTSAPHVLLRPWFDQISANFMARRITDEEARFHLTSLFDAMKTAAEHPAIGESTDRNAAFLTVADLDDGLKRYGDGIYPMPTMDPSMGLPFTGSFYAVNPNSENKERAVLFLAYLAETSIQGAETGRGSGRGTPSVLYADAQIYGKVADAARLALADGVLLPESGDLSAEYNTAAGAVSDGSRSSADAAEQLFRCMKMIRDE